MGQETVTVLQVACEGDVDADLISGWWRVGSEAGACVPVVCGGAHREEQ